MRGERIVWMDWVRGAAIIMVVIFHSTSLLRFGTDQQPAALVEVNNLLSPYRMPLLTFLSGFLAYKSISKTAGVFVWGKVRNLVWPYLIWTAVYALTAGAEYSFTDHELYISYLWYLGYICVYYFASWVMKKVPRIPLVLSAFAIAALIPADIDAARRFFFLMAVFFLGEIAHSAHDSWVAVLKSRWTLVSLVAVAAVSVALFRGSIVLYDPMWASATIAGLILACWAFSRLTRFTETAPMRALEFMGKNSVVFYVVHFPTIWAVMVTLGGLGIDNPWLLFAAAATTAFVVGTVLAHLRRFAVVEILFSLPSRSRKPQREPRVPVDAA